MLQLMIEDTRVVLHTAGFSATPAPPASLDLWESVYTWYLVALLLWRLLTPIIMQFRRPLLVSFVCAVASAHASTGDGPQDVRIRVLHFFPF